jgi:hypothetical protein
MTIEQRINTFSTVGKRLHDIDENIFQMLVDKAKSHNAWFTKETITMAWNGIISFLDSHSLHNWIRNYDFSSIKPRTVGLVLAGNIPLVGFHDLLSVLISGHSVVMKLSSKDQVLTQYIIDLLIEVEPAFKNRIIISERLKDFDAVIATGSDNSSRYFDFYFGKYPHIIRKNRTSCGVLTGNETIEDFQNLAKDVFSYYGLGCRNVSKLYVPDGYSFSPMLDSWEIFKEIGNHHKFNNNYDYQKSIMLVNGVPFLDNGFVMLTASNKLVSPIAVVYYEYYKSREDLYNKLAQAEDKLQCIVGNTKPANIPFGQAQYPKLEDYADQVDTLEFLSTLN